MKENIILGKWAENKLDYLMRKSSEIKDAGSRISFISRQFLNTGYKESTLIGDMYTPEVFVINLQGVDCFTFIEYVEAMRLSGSVGDLPAGRQGSTLRERTSDSFSEFKENLKKVRYRAGEVAFENRNHFFTDWREFNSDFVDDVTEQIGTRKTKSIAKTLNRKEDGTHFLKGIQPIQREIRYIPSDIIDDSIIKKLKTGDYAGMYSDSQGLDVSHVGIIIKGRDSVHPVGKKAPTELSDGVYLRHASSEKEHRKVLDMDFRDYIYDKPGLIVLRPKDFQCLK